MADAVLKSAMVHSLQPMTETDAKVSQRRVLLLEDDAQFKGILTEYLRENNYEVVAVRNGAEGVREIMGRDFDAIVCDMMMPGLPGDMFYLAVERMRPQLCERFIFMTGHQGSDKVCEFIHKIEGTMLSKPFQVDDLLEMIGFVQVKSALFSAN